MNAAFNSLETDGNKQKLLRGRTAREKKRETREVRGKGRKRNWKSENKMKMIADKGKSYALPADYIDLCLCLSQSHVTFIWISAKGDWQAN